MDLSNKIIKLYSTMKYTQAEIAAKLGCSIKNVSYILNLHGFRYGKRRPKNLFKVTNKIKFLKYKKEHQEYLDKYKM